MVLGNGPREDKRGTVVIGKRVLRGPEPRESGRGLHCFVARDADIATRTVAGGWEGWPFWPDCLEGRTGEEAARKSGSGGTPGQQEEAARTGQIARAYTRSRARAPLYTHLELGGGGEESRSECLKIERQRGERSTRTGGRPRSRAARQWVSWSAPGPHGRAGAGWQPTPLDSRSAPGPAGSAR